MRKDRLIILRDYMPKLPPNRIDMAHYSAPGWLYGFELHECHTAGCIAGHTCAIFEPEHKVSARGAQRILQLTDQETIDLFIDHATQPQIIATLDHAIHTGLIEWRQHV